MTGAIGSGTVYGLTIRTDTVLQQRKPALLLWNRGGALELPDCTVKFDGHMHVTETSVTYYSQVTVITY